MMMNLFNMFDPSMKLLNPFIFSFTMILILKMLFNKNKFMFSINKMKTVFFLNVKEKEKSMNFSKIMFSIFFFIFFMNFNGLYPFSWCSSSHFSNNIPLVMIFFFLISMKILSKNKKKFFIHLIPMGTPYLLIPFMFLIELISWLIRPITLTMRLTANLISGHILIHLIYSMPMILNFKLMKISMMLLSTPFIFLEMMVALVQSIIISYLINLYMKE